jgi:molybdopterin/thiamine biosynthesis adenylyltransferase
MTSRADRTARLDGLVPPLAAARVLVVGCGSVGSTMADILVRHGVGSFTLIDPDEVEAPNLSRSVYTAADCGRAKVDALADHLRAVDPATQVVVHSRPAAELGEVGLSDVISACDLVVAATDDPVTQGALNHRSYALDRPALYTALYRGALAGEIVITVPGATPCWACATGQLDLAEDGAVRSGVKDYGTGRLAGEVALGADVLTVVSVAAKAGIGLLAGAGSPAGLHTVTALARHSMCIVATSAAWDWFPTTFGATPGQYAPQSVWMRVEGSDDCPVCGVDRRAPLTVVDRSLAERALRDAT